jgi:hypothetical protein
MFERAIQLERGQIDLESGEFPLLLMTNGEASDGHIVDVRSLEAPDTLPMFVNHDANPVTRMGGMHSPRIEAPRKARLGGDRLRYTGRIDMEGDSALADIRRDVAQGIHVGDVRALSGRWDGGKMTARATLEKNHYAYSELPGGWETPTYFEGATMLEGSIVGLGADPNALAGRAGDLSKPQHVRDFYRSLAQGQPLPEILAGRVAGMIEAAGAADPDWESIELEDGTLVHVPREVAIVWGQSIEGEPVVIPEAAPAPREAITIQPGAEAPVESRSDPTGLRAEPIEANVFGRTGNVDLSAILGEQHDAEFREDVKRGISDLLFQKLGIIPNG